ncbi:MAG: phosphotransferase enzyme family protein [Muribaculaceae bacterium]
MCNDYSKIVSKFCIDGAIVAIEPLGNGLINDTFKVVTALQSTPDYVLQRVNTAIFPDVDMLQANIEAVTSHIRGKLIAAGEADIDRKVLRFVRTSDGKAFFTDDDGSCWRLSVFIPRSTTVQTVNELYSQFAGEAFGNFQAMLTDLPDAIGEVIPDFHNMELRMSQLHDAVQRDAAGRVAEVKDLLADIEANADAMCRAEQLHREGLLPKRICHCDTKVNNMLFDENGKVLCVIDLDTVMPSFIFSDYGDFLRTAANYVAEDSPETEKALFNMDIFRAFTRGYFSSARKFLTPIEIENLPFAAQLFPFMQAVRFLADYINGDTYYKIAYPGHNLVRARNQMHLFHSVSAHLPEMAQFIDSLK